MNIAEILEGCPKGIKLYCPLCGTVTFERVNYGTIICKKANSETITFTHEGYYMLPVNKDCECMLFPSKENRDWSKFIPPFKDGDIIILDTLIGGHIFKDIVAFRNIAIFKSYQEDDFNKIVVYGQVNTIKEVRNYEHVVNLGNWRLATEEEINDFLNILKNQGYIFQDNKIYKKFNTEDLKPYDKILIRSEHGHWYPTLVSYVDSSGNVYTICSENVQKYVLPFEGNENLIGTSDYPDNLFIY